MFILIDHDDSFIYNLKSYVQISGHTCLTVAYEDWLCRYKAMTGSSALKSLIASVGIPKEPLEGIILSPGPGHPSEYALSLALCQETIGTIPLLGVCLGHQIMALAAGAQVIAAPRPMHGKISTLVHDGQYLFAQLPSPLAVTRYHSLIVDTATLPSDYHHNASLYESGSTILMAMTHDSHLAFGLQFHPEALWTEQGQAIMSNFCHLASIHTSTSENLAFKCPNTKVIHEVGTKGIQEINAADSCEAHSSRTHETATKCTSTVTISADSSLYYGLQEIQLPCSLSELLDLYDGEDYITCLHSSRVDEANHWTLLGLKPLVNLQVREGTTKASLAFIKKVEALLQTEKKILNLPPKEGRQVKSYNIKDGEAPPLADGGLFFLGAYEFLLRQQWPNDASYDGLATEDGDMPQAMATVYAIVLMENHLDGKTFLLVQGRDEADLLRRQSIFVKDLDDKISTASQNGYKNCDRFRKRPPSTPTSNEEQNCTDTNGTSEYTVTTEKLSYIYPIDEKSYGEKIGCLIKHMYDGDSYVANLTQTIEITSPLAPLAVFHRLAAANPSPYGSFNKCGPAYMVSASVELFASIKNGEFYTKPIKGTRPRGMTAEEDRLMFEELSQSEKDRSELMMVTDMERNDCNQFAVPGSVTASSEFTVETYATVHQLVSTVRAQIPNELPRPLATWRALLKMAPGGSISGAPKHRSINILRKLEQGPRGLYTGIQGYISFTGDAHLSILIRTAVREGSRWTLGVGGGITVDSESHFEYEELKQKAKALLRALDPQSHRTTPNIKNKRDLQTK